MEDKLNHRGILITVACVSRHCWRWEVSPPKSVLGMSDRSGEVHGDKTDAIRAACAAIEQQTGQFAH